MKQNLLFINKVALGGLTDLVKWCEYLKNDFDITLICFEPENGQYTEIDGINVKYVNSKGNKSIRGIRYILYCLLNILFFKGKIMVVYFEHCDIFKRIFPFKKMILDIRTLAVWGTQKDRDRYDSNIRKACEIYDYVTLISEGVKSRLNLNNSNVYLLPLGSDIISDTSKEYNKIKLLYVGTFVDRNIDKTILGLSIFHNKYPNTEISYDIIGTGNNNELNTYQDLSNHLNIGKLIKFHGRINHNKLKPFFDNSNIGISFVPITSFFDVQPVTKTFEYANSGLFVIGTATLENKKVINKDNGILINDTPEDFAKALEYIIENNNQINFCKVKESLSDFTWQKIINNKLKPLLFNL